MIKTIQAFFAALSHLVRRSSNDYKKIKRLDDNLSATNYDLEMVKKLIDINCEFYKHTPKEMQLKFDDWCEEYERK